MNMRWPCSFYHAWLVDQIEGSLVGWRSRLLARHLEQCDSCTSDGIALTTIPRQLRAIEPVSLPDEFWVRQEQAIARAIRHLPAHRPRPRWSLSLPWQPLTAAVSVVLMIGLLRYSIQRGDRIVVSLPKVGTVRSLDGPTLDHLSEVMASFVPQDDYISSTSLDSPLALPSDEEVAPRRSGSLDEQALASTDDDELEGLADLVGAI